MLKMEKENINNDGINNTNLLEKAIYSRIFAIDYGLNTEFDGKRLDAAMDIAKDLMSFMTWYSGMSEEKILKAIERYVQEHGTNR